MKTNQSISLRWRIAAVLLFLLWGIGGFAQQVSVSNLATDYATKKISFTVTWTAAPYNNQIWVITDYIKVENTTTAGSWSRALVTGATATGSGSAVTVTGQRGFWLNTSGNSGSANVTATVSLASGVDKFNWCVIALNYPPQAVIKATGGYDLKGTPPFTVNGVPLAATATTYGAGTCITSLSDATNNPAGIVPALPTVATVTASTLCAGGTSLLTATLGGGTTSAMTYSWNIGGSPSTTSVNTKTTQTLNANTAFTVTVTNAYGCTSAQKTGAISISSPATSGNTANACGCASGLTDCSGTCLSLSCTNCTCWNYCSGFTQISSVPYENNTITTWSIANTTCQNKGTGWRLPTLPELQCMCAAKNNLPGGYIDTHTWGYWASPASGDGRNLILFEDCSTYLVPTTHQHLGRCVR
ncbi:MAG: hypothetical protein LBG31_03770 [Prevotellaceae bacterium]|jgi:hypothetical protein|nr:hypothetical protein [Prevotellaceae bacterium]